MKSIASWFSLSLLALVGLVQAQELAPIPDLHVPQIPYSHGDEMMEDHSVGHPIIVEPSTYVDSSVYLGTLFTRVKYTDLHEKSPCGVSKIITVKNPCRHDGCCEPETVCIEICVPPCACEKVRCRMFGNRIRYDYGKYAVDVRIKRGYIQVDYQD